MGGRGAGAHPRLRWAQGWGARWMGSQPITDHCYINTHLYKKLQALAKWKSEHFISDIKLCLKPLFPVLSLIWLYNSLCWLDVPEQTGVAMTVIVDFDEFTGKEASENGEYFPSPCQAAAVLAARREHTLIKFETVWIGSMWVRFLEYWVVWGVVHLHIPCPKCKIPQAR